MNKTQLYAESQINLMKLMKLAQFSNAIGQIFHGNHSFMPKLLNALINIDLAYYIPTYGHNGTYLRYHLHHHIELMEANILCPLSFL